MAITLTVTTLADEFAGSDQLNLETFDGSGLALREAIRVAESFAAYGEDVDIVFDAVVAGGTLMLELGSLVISQSIAIHGDALGGGNGDVAISGGDQFRPIAGVIEVAGTAGDVRIDNLVITGARVDVRGLEEYLTPGVGTLAGVGIAAGAVVAMDDVKITGNEYYNINGRGGGIRNFGTLTLTDSEVLDNTAGRTNAGGAGGGIYNEGVLVVEKTLISGNFLGGRFGGPGAGIDNAGSLVLRDSVVTETRGGGGTGLRNTGEAVLVNTTVANNVGLSSFNYGFGSDISNDGSLTLIQSTVSGPAGFQIAKIKSDGDVTLVNSIVIDDDGFGVDIVAGTLTLLGGNIVGTNVYFGANDIGNTTEAAVFANGSTLTDNGGPLPTILLNNSRLNPAINSGDSSLADDADGNPLTTDARGFLRDAAPILDGGVGFTVDLGAVELQSPPATAQPKLRVDGRQLAVRSFGHGEDDGHFAVSPDGRTLVQDTDSWKEVGNVKLTKDTVLIFDFKSGNQGEVHAIGFDNAAGLKKSNVFQLLGTETYGTQLFNDLTEAGDGLKHYELPVGQLIAPGLIGKFLDLVFITDDDAGGGSDSTWSNIEFEERPLLAPADAGLFA